VLPARPCQCRSSEPSPPASRDPSRSIQQRTGRDPGSATRFTVFAPAAPSPTRAVPCTPSPPRAPVYLRTARLLI
jgi:hypothetical protein